MASLCIGPKGLTSKVLANWKILTLREKILPYVGVVGVVFETCQLIEFEY